MLFAARARLYWKKTVPEALKTSRGHRLTAVLKTSYQQAVRRDRWHGIDQGHQKHLFFCTGGIAIKATFVENFDLSR